MKTTLFMLTETSSFMMSFVIVTSKNRCIVVDGGRPLDMPLLKKYVDGRRIEAWILTHAHEDHIAGFIDEMERNGGADFNIGTVYYNFPDYNALYAKADKAPNPEYFKQELNNTLPAFNKIKDKFNSFIVKQGDSIGVDEVRIDFLFSFHDGLYTNLINDSSLVFKLTTPRKTVLFLGDLGPEAGNVLYQESKDKLKADIVQMAHHGHMNVAMEVYAAIDPKACLWCCPLWLYNEPALHTLTNEQLKGRIADGRAGLYGTGATREWMARLGVKKHYVTGYGTQTIKL